MTKGVSSYITLFADAKLLRKINHKDCEELQNDINKIYEWSRTWKMEFNAKKWYALEMRKWNETFMNIKVSTKYYINRKGRIRFGSGNT